MVTVSTSGISMGRAEGEVTVSVVIPAYNTADYIVEALESVCKQTFRDFEVIVINDGSPDTAELEAVLQPYLGRLIYLKQENRGPSTARNLGIRQARGEFLAFLDSDDIWAPEYLSEQMRVLRENPSLAMLYSDCRFFGDTPSTGMSYMQLYPPKSSEVTFENMLLEEVPMIFPSCVVARRSALVEVGLFDESLTYSEDRELALRVAHRGLPIAFLKRPLVMRRAHAGSLNATRQKVEEGELNALEKLGRKLDLSPAQRLILERRIDHLYASIDLREGKQLLAEGKYEEAKQSLARANAILHRRKLHLLLSGLRFAPRLTRWAARAWLAMDSSLEMGRRRLKFGRP